MSRAFVREDVDPPERSGRKRSASGLPPGAANYMTSRGAERLKRELVDLRRTGANNERAAEIERILASVEVVDTADASSSSVAFGATVTVTDAAGRSEQFTILGVDELDLEPNAVSWISPLGRRLLAAELLHKVALDDGRTAKIVRIEYRPDSQGKS